MPMNHKWMTTLAVGAMVLMAGCAGTPPVSAKKSTTTPTAAKTGGYYLDDGPAAAPPPNLDETADAVPRVEPLHPFANRPYSVLGETYIPDTSLSPYQQEGVASWYGKRFHGRKTASGERYDMYTMTAAHRTLPIPSYVRVTSLATGKSVVVRINDRGPFSKNRLIDLSYTAAHKLDYLLAGSTRVRVERLDPAQFDVGGAPLSKGIYLQLGAFSQSENAHKLREKVQSNIAAPIPPVHVVLTDKLHRVTLGPYASEAEAEIDSARLVQALGMMSVKLVH